MPSRKIIQYDDDQRAVIECEANVIVVGATAGSGKTATSIGFAEARLNEKFLYVCFGKANQMDAQARFGANSNVECRTTHSLAFGAVGHKYAAANQVAFNWSARDFASQLRLSDIRSAAVQQSVLGQFFISTDATILPKHALDVADKWALEPNDIDQLVAQSRLAWSKMQQIGSGVCLPPDAYLKIWALSNPKLSKYSRIILDEAQDTNPVTAKIIGEQSHAKKLLIGDRHQSIFLFRGSMNAMETFAASGGTVLNMPKTWRFGPTIANHANELLAFFKNEDVKIIGAGPGSVRRQEKKRAFLSRTNAGLFEAAADVMGKNTHWMGGIEKYKIDTLHDSYLLKTGRRNEIRDATLRSFPSWKNYIDEVEKTRDTTGRMLINLNDKYGKDIPYLVNCFRTNALATEAGASLVLSTIHGAKGMEWDHVQLGEDFDCTGKAFDELMLNPTAPLSAEQVQEINLLYVGFTRARHQLDLNKDSKEFFQNIERYRGVLQEARAKEINNPKFSPPGAVQQQEQPTAAAEVSQQPVFS
jgi:F-box protein, helicase, 18